MTVVMVTHERSIAEQVAERMILMADGKITEQSPPAHGVCR